MGSCFDFDSLCSIFHRSYDPNLKNNNEGSRNKSRDPNDILNLHLTFSERMKELEWDIKHDYFDIEKSVVISSRINGLTKLVKSNELFGNKLFQKMLETVAQKVLKELAPSTIYIHENEVVFIYNSSECFDFAKPFGGNIPDMYSRFSSIVSNVVTNFMKEFIIYYETVYTAVTRSQKANISVIKDSIKISWETFDSFKDQLVTESELLNVNEIYRQFYDFCVKHVEHIYVGTHIIQVSEDDVVNYLYYKSHFTKHNAVRMLYKNVCKDENIAYNFSLNINELIKGLENRKINFNEVLSNYELYGVYMKRESYELELNDEQKEKSKNHVKKNILETTEHICYIRTRPILLHLNIDCYDEKINRLLLDEYFYDYELESVNEVPENDEEIVKCIDHIENNDIDEKKNQ